MPLQLRYLPCIQQSSRKILQTQHIHVPSRVTAFEQVIAKLVTRLLQLETQFYQVGS